MATKMAASKIIGCNSAIYEPNLLKFKLYA